MLKKIVFLSLFLCSYAWAQGVIEPVVVMEEAFNVTMMDVSPDGELLALALSDGTVRLINTRSGRQEAANTKLNKAITDISFTGNGNELLISSDRAYMLNVRTNELVKHNFTVTKLLKADSAGETAVGAQGRTLNFYNLASDSLLFTTQAPSEVYALAIDSISRIVYAGGKDGVIRGYSLRNGAYIRGYEPNIGVIRSIAVANGHIMAGGELSAAVIDITKGEVKTYQLATHSDVVTSVSITANARFAVTGSDDSTVTAWDIINKEAVRSESLTAAHPVTAVAIDPYFRYIAYSSTVPGRLGGETAIYYTGNIADYRKIYAYRDATLTIDTVGHVDGLGQFSKYISYKSGADNYSFNDVAETVHSPEALKASMTLPLWLVAEGNQAAIQAPRDDNSILRMDTTPPVIAVHQRGFEAVSEDEVTYITGSITDESGLMWAKVGERTLLLDSDNNFSVEVRKGVDKEIIISASDTIGNATSRTIFVNNDGAVADNKTPAAAASVGKRYALVIGINKYRYLPALSTAEFDARIVSEILRVRYGYEATLLLGERATRSGIMGELNKLRNTATANDKILVYYAGHGQLDARSGNAYWQGYDAEQANDTNWILTSQVLSAINAANAKEALIIADSCFSGAVSNVSGGGERGRALISSGGWEPVSDISNGQHSLFTGALIKALKFHQPNYSVNKLYDTIIQSMPDDEDGTQQKPQLIILSGDGKQSL